jgi:hypothetical protein
MKPFGVISRISDVRLGSRLQLMALVPGLLLLALGIAAFLAPQIVAMVLAALLLCVGCVALFVGWKLIQLRRRVQEVMQGLSQQIQVVRLNVADFQRDPFEAQPEEGAVVIDVSPDEPRSGSARSDTRKIIVH